MLKSKKLPESVVGSFDFDLGDYKSLEMLNKAIEKKSKECRDKVNGAVYKHYVNVTPYPSAKGFYPTGGIRWTEMAWDFQQYRNNHASADTHKIGDNVKLTNIHC